MTELTTATALVLATAMVGFLSLVATLLFLWKVYKHGGRNDLTAAAKALQDALHRRAHAAPAVERPEGNG
jgi:hypothetical protein